jgi:hypothetical protein
MTDFFDDAHQGAAGPVSFRSPIPWLKDALSELRLALSPRRRRILRARREVYRVLVVGVEVPARAGDMQRITARLTRSRHRVDISTVVMKPQGKFANVNEAIAAAPRPLAEYDWLIVTDDDVALSTGFLDEFLALATEADLVIAQPAHRFASHASFWITRQKFGSLVRESRFVEIGPISAFRKEAFAEVAPFPDTRWCYGIDLMWSAIAEQHGWRMGIVDGTPLRHLKPVARSYDAKEALAEGRDLLERHEVRLTREDVLQAADLIRA